jgi:predicted deacylase
LRFTHHSGEEVELPVARVIGARSGPRFGVTAGMHAGEIAGMRTAIKLWQQIDPAELRGELVIIPIMSTRAFFARSTQLSPVDEREMHDQMVGRPDGSYSEFLADHVFNIVRNVDFHVDLHAGEYLQSLSPWVRVPEPYPANEPLLRQIWRLASCFPVPYLHPTGPMRSKGLPAALIAEGIPNLWTEVGQNAIQETSAIDIQLRGIMNALHMFGLLEGDPEHRQRQLVLGPEIWRPLAKQSGYWRPLLRSGETVRRGQPLGELCDFEGNVVESFVAPWDGVVQLVWTSPAIDGDRKPHGYWWHQGLFGIVEVRGELAPIYE